MHAVRLPSDIEARLDDLARRTGRSKSFYVRQAIVEHLADLEDLFLAEARFDALKRGESGTVTLAELERDLGLAD